MSEELARTGDGRTAHRLARALRCSQCGAHPRDPSQAADLATPWLVGEENGAVTLARFCAVCAPGGAVGEVECVVCGDGPLLTAELARGDLLAGAAVDGWLAETGWRPAGPWCPECDPARDHPTRTRSA